MEYLLKVQGFEFGFWTMNLLKDVAKENITVDLKNTFLVLDLSFDIVDGVAALDLESNGLPC